MQLNAGSVDVIQVGELYAATGNVEILADNLIGTSNGRIGSKNEASISVINNSNSPIETNNIYIPDDPGGTIYYNEQIVRTTSDVTRLNRSNGAVGFGMISDPGNFEATVNIESTYDALAHANGLDIKSPEMLLAGNIENRGGLVRVINKYGSIYQNATINAAELKLTSGGNLFIQGKGDGIHNLGPHPDAAFSNYVDDRENALGQMELSVVKAPWRLCNIKPCQRLKSK